ncbi:stress-related protein-like isoform X2 [Camellia sinensis]|uniref:stress-related protein-like isoform X2 n=1 Tax=Camellia sinensis TaxID=4442 RepID=UPI0010360D49|nr:stress-related protein-like isoform X2 [Camellia sinensis]
MKQPYLWSLESPLSLSIYIYIVTFSKNIFTGMAKSDLLNIQPQMGEREEEERLKYLEFVQVATIHVLMCLARLYDYAKDNYGPLKPSVEIVEGTVKGTIKTVVGPVYDKFHDVPIELLKFVDRKVDKLAYL